MGKVFKIGISKNKNNQRELGLCLFPVINVNEIEVIHGKGIVGDRYFLENNEKRKQGWPPRPRHNQRTKNKTECIVFAKQNSETL